MADDPALIGETPFLTAHWRDLVMLTWAVNPVIVTSSLPRNVVLDLWQDQALASIVAFRFERVRVRGLAIPLHTAFPEVNLRYYVKRQASDGTWRRGVVFVKEIVPRAAIAAVARLLYGEPYVAFPMQDAQVGTARGADAPPRSLVYEWKRAGAWEKVVGLHTMPPHPMRHGSIEQFIAEHYWGYTARGKRPTREYRVAHPSWNVAPLAEWHVEADLEGLYGLSWASALDGKPVSTFVADGSDVAVYAGRDVPEATR